MSSREGNLRLHEHDIQLLLNNDFARPCKACAKAGEVKHTHFKWEAYAYVGRRGCGGAILRVGQKG